LPKFENRERINPVSAHDFLLFAYIVNTVFIGGAGGKLGSCQRIDDVQIVAELPPNKHKFLFLIGS